MVNVSGSFWECSFGAPCGSGRAVERRSERALPEAGGAFTKQAVTLRSQRPIGLGERTRSPRFVGRRECKAMCVFGGGLQQGFRLQPSWAFKPRLVSVPFCCSRFAKQKIPRYSKPFRYIVLLPCVYSYICWRFLKLRLCDGFASLCLRLRERGADGLNAPVRFSKQLSAPIFIGVATGNVSLIICSRCCFVTCVWLIFFDI